MPNTPTNQPKIGLEAALNKTFEINKRARNQKNKKSNVNATNDEDDEEDPAPKPKKSKGKASTVQDEENPVDSQKSKPKPNKSKAKANRDEVEPMNGQMTKPKATKRVATIDQDEDDPMDGQTIKPKVTMGKKAATIDQGEDDPMDGQRTKPKATKGKDKAAAIDQGEDNPMDGQTTKPKATKGKGKQSTKYTNEDTEMQDKAEDHKSDYEQWQDEDKSPSTSTAKVTNKPKGKKNPKITVITKKVTVNKSDLLTPNITMLVRCDIQEMFEGVQKDIASMILGYALMSVLDNSDNGRGPTLFHHSINQWDIDLEFMEKSLKLNIKTRGLQNTIAVNTIIIGVKQDWIKPSSLKPVSEDLYTNRVA